MKRDNFKKACIANIIVFLLEFFSISWMMSGISSGILSVAGLRALKFFTVDSNIYLGIASLIAAVAYYRAIKEKQKDIPSFIYLLKLSATSAVIITFLVTVFFLEPTMGRLYGYLILFAYSNLFLHLINPLAAIFTWIAYERNNALSLKSVFLAMIPTVLYVIYYVVEVITHTRNGIIMPGYDWYGFFALGLKSAIIILPYFLLFTFLVCFVLYRLGINR